VHSTVLVFQIDASGAVSTNLEPLVQAMQNSPIPIAVVGRSGPAAPPAPPARCSRKRRVTPASHPVRTFGPVYPVYYDKHLAPGARPSRIR